MLHSAALRLLAGLDLGGVYSLDLEIEGRHLDQLQGRAEQLRQEIFPDTASAGFFEWERAVGLPDPCTGALTSLGERRAALLGKVAAKGRLDRGFYLDLAAALGYSITITEFPVAAAGAFHAGDGLGNEDSVWTWLVYAPAETAREFTCQNACTDPLTTWGNALLICAMARLAPAHTEVLFAYSE